MKKFFKKFLKNIDNNFCYDIISIVKGWIKLKYIVVIIPEFKFYNIIFESEFIDHNEFRTQNLIIKSLKLLGLKNDKFVCDLCYKSLNN